MKLDVKKLISKLTSTPMVVEQGTSGIWNYRKWSNGTSECWGIWSGTLSHYATINGFYSYYTSVAYPPNLFKADTEPIVTYQPTVENGFAMPATHFMTGAVATNYYAIATLSGTRRVEFSIHVLGKWK